MMSGRSGVGRHGRDVESTSRAIDDARGTRVAPLDGMRAFAVLAVILFHAYTPWAIGGFYGVDVFFVLSGYLITSILVSEWQDKGRISLRHFWARRARRLLPALFLMLLVVLLVADIWPSVLGSPGLLGDTLATIFYSSNWRFLAEHANYFTTYSNPSPLLHTWTLAIEEQFYLVWPILVVAVLTVFSRRGAKAIGGDSFAEPGSSRRPLTVLLVLALVGAAASATWMWVLTPMGTLNVNRAYYGSDTRAQAILIGAALALACALWGPVWRAASRVALYGAGILGALVLVFMWRNVAETSDLAFHGGFAVVALAAAAVVLCVSQLPKHPLALAIGIAPLRYLGRISYGMYLWYWPVLLVATANRVHLGGLELLSLRIAVIVALASCSFHFVETPIQNGVFHRWRPILVIPAVASLLAGMAVAVPDGSLSAAIPTGTAYHLHTSHGTPPVRILVVGDSMAGSLGVGLSLIAPVYGAQVVNQGSPGCSLAEGNMVKVLWYTDPPGPPCASDDPDHLLSVYRSLVRQFDPDVVVYLARSDTLDTELDGSWQNLGEPTFDRWAEFRYQQAIAVLSSRGAHVVFMTSPFYDSGDESDGQPLPENQPSRVAIDNRLLVKAAGHNPKLASVFNLGGLLSPADHFATQVDGVPVRCQDGVHLTVAGGQWVGERVLPHLVALGRSHAIAAVAAHRPVLPPQAPPFWYSELPCSTVTIALSTTRHEAS
jgi:peptidoglycan/LPS O-acetylase OafA/YrhL